MSTSLGLKFDKFIAVDSKSLHIAEKLGKLSTVLITKRNDHLVSPKWTAFNRGDDKQIAAYFGNASVLSFAKNYFTFQNRAGDFADRLHVYTWAHDKAQNPALIGGDTPQLDELKKINGKVQFTIDNTSKTIELNFTTKNSHTEIAAEFTTSLKKNNNNVAGFKDATVTWSSIYSAFVITAGASTKTISYAQSPTDGTDVSAQLGLLPADGARVVDAYVKVDTIVDVLEEISTRNDTYFFITFDFEVDTFDKDLMKIGEWVHQQKNQYCILYSSTKAELLKQPTYTNRLHGYNGLLIEYTPNLHTTNGKSAGLFSSVDFSKNRGNISYAYNQVDTFRNISVKEEDAYDTLTNPDKNRANGYVTVRRLTSGFTWYMPGNIMGTDTTHLNVYVANFVIMQLLQQGFASWLSNNKFPSISDSTALRLFSNSIMQQALAKALITPVDSLDVDEVQQLSSIFHNASDAEFNIVANGFYTEVGEFDAVNRCVNLKVAYVANVPIRKLCIKLHALRG